MNDFDDILGRLEGPLGRVAAGEGITPELPTVRGEGADDEEHIRVVMEGGTFTEITVSPLALRQSNAELGDRILTAFNAALVDHSEKSAAALAEQSDLGDLQSELAQLRIDSAKAMQKYADSMFDALAQMNRIDRGDS